MLIILRFKLQENYPNTYTYSKFLAERLVEQYHATVPCVIVRPSIGVCPMETSIAGVFLTIKILKNFLVCASWKEPFPGWVDNNAGITGMMQQVSRGMIRSIVYADSCMADLIPVDVVANTLITAAWFSAVFR